MANKSTFENILSTMYTIQAMADVQNRTV